MRGPWCTRRAGRASFPAMRRTPSALSFTRNIRRLALGLTVAALGVTATACKQEKKDLLALPAAYDPAGADLTFNKKNLEAFNLMSKDARRQHVKQLKETAGSFQGQAIFQSGNGLAPTVEDSQHGAYELFANVPTPVLYEITIDYQIFTTPELGRPLAPNHPISFRGTLIDLRFEDETKPRKLTMRVKADNVETITDKTGVGAAAPAPPAPPPAS